MHKALPFVIGSLLTLTFFLADCTEPPVDNNFPANAHEEDWQQLVPVRCQDEKGDLCALFECMVDYCWCAPQGVLSAGTMIVDSDAKARQVVQAFIEQTGSEYGRIENAVQLNALFWNVFAYNSENEENVFTVAVDGSILNTQCGV